ncbi:MAG: repair protein RecN [Actinomycetia bacterium]|nr:repair protein RecN [Actinomycetes bacterium]
MLSELRVENLGIVSEVLITLGPGMTAITGETGAGKTLLVDALVLLLGGRADPALVRDGATEARVEGRFLSGDDEVVLTRVVPRDGRSRGYVNGRLATAAELADHGRVVADLHGQHAHQSLIHAPEQRALLDTYTGAPARNALDQLRAARAEVRRIDEDLVALGGDERARAREADLLRYQLAEIDAAALADLDEEARLEREERLLADADAYGESLADAQRELNGPVEEALGHVVASLGAEPFAELATRAHALQAEAAELAHDVRVVSETLIADPERLAAVRERRQLVRDLCRKYGATIAEVREYGAESHARLAEIESHEERAAALEAKKSVAESDATTAATALTRARRASAKPLAEAVTERLRELAMPNATFTVMIEAAPLTDDGADDVSFLLAPNPGEAARPLARAASGGELSRAMLALRVVLSEAPPTLVFDEVDAGIGGEAGVAVGRSMASLGGKHQVLCVTHLAQVAAFADAHIVVAKQELDGRTVASAGTIDGPDRVAELSRMLAGVGDSAHARRHARELLTRAATARDAVRTA